jgi:hypothetical protein
VDTAAEVDMANKNKVVSNTNKVVADMDEVTTTTPLALPVVIFMVALAAMEVVVKMMITMVLLVQEATAPLEEVEAMVATARTITTLMDPLDVSNNINNPADTVPKNDPVTINPLDMVLPLVAMDHETMTLTDDLALALVLGDTAEAVVTTMITNTAPAVVKKSVEATVINNTSQADTKRKNPAAVHMATAVVTETTITPSALKG